MTGRRSTPPPSEAVARHLVQLSKEAIRKMMAASERLPRGSVPPSPEDKHPHLPEPQSWETGEPRLAAAKRVWSASVNDFGSGEELSVRPLFVCRMHTIEMYGKEMKMAKKPTIADPERPLGQPADQKLGPEERRRLSGAALRTFLSIADLWGLDEEARSRVIGILRPKIYERCCARARAQLPLMLNAEALKRISEVLQIHAGLTVLFADQREALGWLSRPHDTSPFEGRSPKELLTQGDFEDLMAVRRFLDAACTGIYMPPQADDREMPPYEDDEIQFDAGGR